MKSILITIAVIILIPIIVVTAFFNEPEIDYGIRSNTIVRVKRLESDTIDVLSLEEYVTGVIAGEMPVSFEKEALKAQAVASRSYALTRIDSNKEYDVVDSTLNQVYLDIPYLKQKWGILYNQRINKIREAVKESEGEYLESDGKIADCLFFSTSNGYTENSEDVFGFAVSYLKSVESSWDETESSVFKDTSSFSLDEFYANLEIDYSEKLEFKKVDTTDTGRIKKVNINGNDFTGSEVRSLLKIRSTDFDITQNEDKIVVNTKGYGHGVGMSQYGANGMAKNGKNYQEILSHYYTGTILKKIKNDV